MTSRLFSGSALGSGLQTLSHSLIEKLRIGRPVAIVILLVVFAATFAHTLEIGQANASMPKTDLASFYGAAKATFVLHRSPYDLSLLKALSPGAVWPFIYPPTSLPLLWPLAGLDYDSADRAMLYMNLGLWALLLWLVPFGLLRLQPEKHWPLVCVYFIGGCGFLPMEVNLETAQVNLLVALGLVMFWLLGNARFEKSAALFLAAVIAFKVYPIVILPLLWISGRRSAVIWTLLWLILIGIASALAVPPSTWRDWLVDVFPHGGYGRAIPGLLGPASMANVSLNGLFSRAFTTQLVDSPSALVVDPLVVAPLAVPLAAYSVNAILFAFTAVAVRRSARRSSAARLDHLMMSALPIMYLIAPISWVHHLVYLFPLLLAAAVRRPDGAAMKPWVGLSVAVAAFLMLNDADLTLVQMFPVLALWLYGITCLDPPVPESRPLDDHAPSLAVEVQEITLPQAT